MTRFWFDQNEIESKLAGSALTSCSTSERNTLKLEKYFNHGSRKENSDSENKLYMENDGVSDLKQWLIHLDNLSEHLTSFYICKYCSGELEMKIIVHVLV